MVEGPCSQSGPYTCSLFSLSRGALTYRLTLPMLPPPLQDFARSKLRLFVAAGLGVLLLQAGSAAAFDWYYKRSGG